MAAVLLDPQMPLSLNTCFDLIVSSMALHHVPNLAPLFKRFHEQLHPSGGVALADLGREDGSFHEEAMQFFHLGFERSEVQTLLTEAGFVDLGAKIATITRKKDHDYPVFLITGRKVD